MLAVLGFGLDTPEAGPERVKKILVRQREHFPRRKEQVQAKGRFALFGLCQCNERCLETSTSPISLHCRSKLAIDRKRDLIGRCWSDTSGRIGKAHTKRAVSNRLTVRSECGEFRSARDRSDHALSLWRPLMRRERNTARPPRVALRARKPCFIARLRLFGWNVRFI